MLIRILLCIALSLFILTHSNESYAADVKTARASLDKAVSGGSCSNSGGDVGVVADCIHNEVKQVGNVMGGLAIVMAFWFGVKTAISLKDHNENPQQTPLKRPITYLVMTGCFLSLPEFMGMTVNTFFDQNGSNPYPVSLSE